jgi:hypothetical protein
MKTVVLFGEGGGKGIIITGNGIVPIPPFSNEIWGTLAATARLVKASTYKVSNEARSKMLTLANSISDRAIVEVKDSVGAGRGGFSLVYQDTDSGFVCGSIGPRPIPNTGSTFASELIM